VATERFSFPRAELRGRMARGVIVNGSFLLVAEGLVLIQQLVVARLLSTEQVGLYGIVSITVITLLTLKQIGIDEQFVQQSEEDQELAFQRAFSLDLVLGAGFAVFLLLLAPAVAVAYGDWALAPLMLALAYLPIAFALQAPSWIFFRRMDFMRQRIVQTAAPAATFVVTLILLIAGMDVWALVLGALVGNIVSAAVAARISPYRLRLRFDRETAKLYARFSWPILVAAVAGLVIRQGQVFAFDAHLGLAGAGYITLAVTLTRYADRADQIVTTTIYPAICAVTDRKEVMTELFVKSNRITAMWALPFGAGLALFAPDLVEYVLGDKWEPAVILLQLMGVTGAVHQLGFNWTAFYRAVGISRPQAVYALAAALAFLAVPLPLLFISGINGFAWGMLAVMAAAWGTRAYYIKVLLPDVGLTSLAIRALVPTLAATGIVLLARLAEDGRSLGVAIAELVLFIATFAVVTWLRERALLLEILTYLRDRAGRGAPAAQAAGQV
jgi:O-antigen/teichoic acid export membrane protein